MDIHNEFIAQEKDLVFYRGKPILNKVHRFWDINGNPWDFSAATNFFFTIWEEREGGREVIDWDDTNLSNTDNDVILNAPAIDTDVELGYYYYEMGYLVSGGYAILTAFGKAQFI